MAIYDLLFAQKGVPCSQILLTEHDFQTEQKYVRL